MFVHISNINVKELNTQLKNVCFILKNNTRSKVIHVFLRHGGPNIQILSSNYQNYQKEWQMPTKYLTGPSRTNFKIQNS